MLNLYDILTRGYRHEKDSSLVFHSQFGYVKTVGRGDEFKVAVKSCYDAHPEIPMYLFTNVEYLDADIQSMLHRIYKVDLMLESGLDKLYASTGDSKFGFGTKAYSVISGWKWGVLPEWVLHLDVDIVILETSKRWNLMKMFEPLKVCYYVYCFVIIFCIYQIVRYLVL